MADQWAYDYDKLFVRENLFEEKQGEMGHSSFW